MSVGSDGVEPVYARGTFAGEPQRSRFECGEQDLFSGTPPCPVRRVRRASRATRGRGALLGVAMKFAVPGTGQRREKVVTRANHAAAEAEQES